MKLAQVVSSRRSVRPSRSSAKVRADKKSKPEVACRGRTEKSANEKTLRRFPGMEISGDLGHDRAAIEERIIRLWWMHARENLPTDNLVAQLKEFRPTVFLTFDHRTRVVSAAVMPNRDAVSLSAGYRKISECPLSSRWRTVRLDSILR